MDQEASQTPWLSRLGVNILQELGLMALINSNIDIKLLIAQRFVRLIAYGGSTLILVSYLSTLGISDTRIGLFMTLTLIGDVFISFFLTLITDSIGRRFMLALGAAMMAGSGVIFALFDNYFILLAAAILGIISPSGNEIGPFRAIEESTLAHLSLPDDRASIFAYYNLIGSLGAAIGMMACGWVVHTLQAHHGFEIIASYRVIFFAYAGVGLIKLGLTMILSNACELQPEPKPIHNEETPLLGNQTLQSSARSKQQRRPLLPQISRESRGIFLTLALLFALDNLGSSIAPLAWITNYFKRRFGLSENLLGSLFFTTSIIQAISVLVAASLARRIGNVKTMVFTHLPSSIALAALGLPASLPVAMALLLFRASTQSMDSAPRSAFLAAILLPNERTAIMGAINVVKTASQSIGPVITGQLVERDMFWIAFLMAGGMKVVYDLSLLAVFANRQTRENAEEVNEGESG
ncbi:MFS general substrate transporter [Microthyrium microscopicum]|uniref:MFS general substrate transporter n=1 Tax=Microthyrium microscopicum TaxID=703497 RepID=A0A6A6UET1_9PEZI|nr:MFS general substrate transporter [Microthyrium microscopicum]